MANEWKRVSLREAGVTLIDCDHRTPPAVDSGYPYVAIPQLKEGRLSLGDVRRISPEHFTEWTRKAKPQHHDVILSRRCNPGETAYVPVALECALGQNLVLLRADGKKMFPPFLRWLVRGEDWWEQVGKFINVGAVFDSLRCADIPNFSMPVPPFAKQKAIAAVLGALDGKIELNLRMNATLEAIARTQFQSWFVDFDPVRTKIDGHAPIGVDPATAAIFPDSFQESTLGHIPKGWEVKTTGEVSTVGIGKTPPRLEKHWFSENPADVPWMSIRDLGTAGAFISRTSEFLTTEAVEKFRVKRIPDDTVVLSFKLTMGRVAITDGEMLSNEAIAHFRLNRETTFGSAYLYCYLKGFGYDQLGSTSSIATAINSDMVRSMRVLIPPKGIAEAFERTVKPLFAQMKNIQRQSHSLATLRDTLLPKLLCGDIQISNHAN